MTDNQNTSQAELFRTSLLVIFAVLFVGLAFGARKWSEVKPDEQFEKLGTQFYPEFEDPNAAKSLRVVAFDEDLAAFKSFQIAFQDGKWVIPTHHNYPADAQDRLAETAASIIGIERTGLADRRANSHERFGVIDPMDVLDEQKATTLKGHGKRITLFGNTEKDVLADYIIGKKVEDQDGTYYVRAPKEKETYIAKLNIDLSTKFTDWIESDLLKVGRDDLSQLVINKYSVKERVNPLTGSRSLFMTDEEISRLSREKWSEPWQLEGLKPETEEVNEDNVREIVNALDELKIVGVRKKPEGLLADLSFDPRLKNTPLEEILLRSLQQKGFLLYENQKGKTVLISKEGGITAGSNKGINYQLYFGEVFTGSMEEIEIGNEKSEPVDPKKKTDDSDEKPAEKEETPEAGQDNDDNKDESDLSKSRYLFVRAELAAELIPDKPVAPVKPEKPTQPKPTEKKADPEKKPTEKKPTEQKTKPEDKQKPAEDKETKANSTADSDTDQPKQEKTKSDDPKSSKAESKASEDKTEPKSDDKPEPDKPTDKPEADDKPKPEDNKKEPAQKSAEELQKEYEQALEKYNADLKTFEQKTKAHDEKVKAAQEEVDKLNKRFAEWYYVISAADFETLRLSRADLVKPKEKKENEKPDANGQDAKPDLKGLIPPAPPKEKK